MSSYQRARILVVFVSVFAVSNAQSRCVTPNGVTADCISIYSCPSLLKVVRSKDSEQIRFLRESQCGYSGNPLVCCGQESNYRKNNNNQSPFPSWGGNQLNSGGGNWNGNQNGGQGGSQGSTKVLPDRSQCGKQTSDKILGGEVASLDEYPWMALLQYRKRNNALTFACGGTLISKRYVLTAAHCVTGQILTKVGPLVSVRLGEFDTDTQQDCISQYGAQICNEAPVDIDVENSIPHSGYSDTNVNRYDDIALVRLKKDVKYHQNFIQPICLPKTESANVGDFLVVAGWGRTEYSTSSSKKLKLKVPLKSPSQCAARFKAAGVNLGNRQLCAGGEAGKDSCNGDSGGPLMTTFDNSAQWYLEGVVSFGARCGSQGWPGIYTRVASYIPWIEENVRA